MAAYGGSGLFLYELFLGAASVSGGPQVSPLFTGLAANNYTAFVYDQLAIGCDSSVDISLEVPEAVSFTYTSEDVSCSGGADGSITVILDAGMDNPPYIYQLFDVTGLIPQSLPQTSNLFTNLSPNTYTVRVTSARLCFDTNYVTIGEPLPVAASASATDFACNADNSVAQAVITAVGSDGTAPYTYSINGTDFFASNTFNVNDTGAQQTFTVTVRDDNGCTDTDTVTIEPLNRFTAAVSTDAAISCAGPEQVTVTVSDDGNPANTYSFELLPVGNANGAQTGTPAYNTATYDLAAAGKLRLPDHR